MFPNIKIVEAIRKEYPAGTRVWLVKIRNQSPASEVLLTLCGWNIDTLLDKTPPIAIED